ncbi:MAG: M12 family metallo-peptidase [Betaproteobacteria bacterium]
MNVRQNLLVGASQPQRRAAPWHWLGVAAMGAAVLAAPQPARAVVQADRLLGTASAADNERYSALSRRAAAGVARQMPVALDLRRFYDRQKAAAADIVVQLFDGQAVTLTPERLEQRADGNYTWHGKLAGHPNGFALITVVNGQVSGTIDLGGGGSRSRYQLQSTADGLTVLQELDAATFPEDHPSAGELVAPLTPTLSGHTKDALARGSVADLEKADSATTIDVMIVYSNQTAAAAGGAIAAQAQQAVDTANLTYANSGITTRLRLVYAGPANYDESGDFNTDLNRLTNGTDGYMDDVAAMRDAYGADLVSLFVENGQYCGLGWIGPSAGYGFTVVNRGCASGNLSFPHEIGHNFGARHDTYVDASSSPYAYGHGWVDIGQHWRDVMAYNNACAAYGVSCTRIPYFSNPAMSYGSPADPLGATATSDVARVHNQNALTVANFRASKQGGTAGCTWSLSTASASVTAAAGSGTIGITTQSGCAWNAASNANWLSVGSASSGAGSLAFSYTANAGPARSGNVAIGGVTFTVGQASGCAYSLGATSASVGAAGASGSTALSTGAGCTWTASSSAAWLTPSSTGGAGAASIGFVAAVNTGAARSANLSIGGQTFVVSQAATTYVSPPAASPVAVLSTTGVDFGSVVVGKSSTPKTMTLMNGGGGSLSIGSLTIGGINAVEFTRGGTCVVGGALAQGQSCTLVVTFKPATTGTRSASLSAGTSSGTVSLSLTGTGRRSGKR